MTRETVPSLRLAGLALAAALIVGLMFATIARADDMGGMNMTPEEMQNMPQTDPTATAPAMNTSGDQMSGETGAHDGMAGMPGMDGSGAGTNWLVVGGVGALIAGGTAAAVLVKRRLARKMLTGELARAGALDV